MNATPLPDRAPLRVPRGLLAGSWTVVGAAAAHVLAGGDLPGPAVLLATVAVVLGAAAVLARHRLDAAVLTALALAAEGLLHLLFVLAEAAAPAGAGCAPSCGSGTAMLLTHGAVAAVAVLLARGGEEALLALAATAAARAAAVLLPVLPAPASAAPAPAHPAAAARPVALRSAPARGPAPLRGPPALLAG